MKLFLHIPAAILICIQSANAFGVVAPSTGRTASSLPTASSSALSMANNEDLLRFSRASRSAGNDDNVVELMRPLGLVLNQDDDGNVYVETVAPRGNAARTGKVCRLLLFRKPRTSLEVQTHVCGNYSMCMSFLEIWRQILREIWSFSTTLA